MRLNDKVHVFSVFAIVLAAAIFQIASGQIIESVPDVPAGAISPPDPLFDREVSRGINLTFQDRYEESAAIFDSLIKYYPDQPAPYFFKAASYQNWMSSFRISKFQAEVEKNIDKTIELGNALKGKSDNAWLYFYIGAAYGYRGFNRFRKHNWIGAYKDGKRGIENFEQALLADSSLYDVYLGLGAYHYWRTAKSALIRLIAFWIPDKRDLGIQQLQFAMDHGRYSPNEASYVLLAAYFDKEEFDSAKKVLTHIQKKKSQPNITDLYFQGRLLVEDNNWPQVESTFRQIFELLKNHPYPSIGYQVECKYWIARSLKEQNKLKEARYLASAALAQSRERNSDQELEGHLEGFDEIKDQLEKLYDELKEQTD